ncbi:hypothetical protein FHU10_3040 [Serratia fonticola]|uniref:Uncharacterized protein n=1 Tax=Serratia fonticola TaxID=47917 RepID=A0A559T786_SERFO|nr:hypothetical protein FHU09_4669 [Serratia fonticola]TQI95970.1 hypothetical protein FHU11_1379 [Serratia fonticola]TVZ70467.1 hypothetical protein FHU10_3040 [Serratia fonticola]
MASGTARWIDKLSIHILILIGNIENMQGFMSQQAAILSHQAVFMLLFHHKNHIDPRQYQTSYVVMFLKSPGQV